MRTKTPHAKNVHWLKPKKSDDYNTKILHSVGYSHSMTLKFYSGPHKEIGDDDTGLMVELLPAIEFCVEYGVRELILSDIKRSAPPATFPDEETAKKYALLALQELVAKE